MHRRIIALFRLFQPSQGPFNSQKIAKLVASAFLRIFLQNLNRGTL